jgi:hypothetical protein
MSTFHRVEPRGTGRTPPTETESRLTAAQSVAVLAGLSAVSWALLISIGVALRAVL